MTAIRLIVPTTLFTCLALITPIHAQQRKPSRVGVMVTGERGLNLLRQGLGERGYAEGKNLDIIYRSVQGNTDRMPDVVSEILASNVGSRGIKYDGDTRGSKRNEDSADRHDDQSGPVTIGLVQSLARPGGNLTGWSA